MKLRTLFCISFASRQITNLVGVNSVHIPPGTSKTPEYLFEYSGVFFIKSS